MSISQYCCPFSKEKLLTSDSGLSTQLGVHYPFLNVNMVNKIPVFIDDELLSGGDKISQVMYTKDNAEQAYDNFLAWLFETFNVDEISFRSSLLDKLNLKEGNRVLITGCGLGDDVLSVLPKVGGNGEVYAQDISDLMVAATARRLKNTEQCVLEMKSIYLSVSNASVLPYEDHYFDAAYHFGGINLFSDIKSAISEMSRVVKVGGKVVLGDEGIAPWLKEHEYGKMAICNNKLWALDPPLALLPETASDVHLSWVLGHCFYVIDFTVAASIPYMNIDVPHKGGRGGSIRKRYFGQLEGVDPILKEKISSAAASAGISVSAWLEQVIGQSLVDNVKNN
jgi:ubiquinone/menaquinone biosynthesis C-methylase UbiE